MATGEATRKVLLNLLNPILREETRCDSRMGSDWRGLQSGADGAASGRRVEGAVSHFLSKKCFLFLFPQVLLDLRQPGFQAPSHLPLWHVRTSFCAFTPFQKHLPFCPALLHATCVTLSVARPQISWF